MRAHWSAYEVLDANPGVSIELRDLLTGAERTVAERTASRTVEPHSVVLARLAERMRDIDVQRALVRAWARQVKAADARAEHLTLHNTDGEPVLLTTDRFVFDPGARADVETRLATIAERAPGDGPESTFEFTVAGNALHRDWTKTIIGFATVSDGGLKVVTNSLPRAEMLRALVESTCGGTIRHRARDHTDPRALARRPQAASRTESPPEEVAQMLLGLKRRHYDAWVDAPIPALGNLTPREAARRPKERRRLEALLRDMEYGETKLSEVERFDFGTVRAALGLEG